MPGSNAPPNIALRDRFPTFTAAEIARRHARVRELMAQEEIDVAVAYGAGRFNAEMLYFTNWPGGREGYFLLPSAGDPVLLVQLFNHVPLARRLSLVPDTRWAGSDSVETVATELRHRGQTPRRIGLIGPWKAHDHTQLAVLIPGTELIDLTGAYRSLRLERSEEELAFIRIAARLTDISMEALQNALRPGLQEYELCAVVEGAYLQRGGYAGIHYMSSTPMDNPTAYVPHQYQSARTIEQGDALITEISGSFWGYSSQIHRTFTVGVPPTAEYRRIHEVAVAAFDAVTGALRDGATVDDVLDAAELIHHHGYTIFDDLLHGADQYPPILRTRPTDHGHPSEFQFRENMVVTVQPHVVTPDLRMGVQFGETVRITHDGVETLHNYPREIILAAR